MAKIFSKKQLINAVAEETNFLIKDIKNIFNVASKIQKQQLKAGCIVKTQNGSIRVVTRKARNGVDPRTGKKINIPAAKKPKFTFSEDFKKGF